MIVDKKVFQFYVSYACNVFICKCTPQVALVTFKRPMERLKMTDIACCQRKWR